MNPAKDLYAILGVSPNSTLESIREAYLARVRVLHPDRFNREHQPKEWRLANEMLTELNEAYAILRIPASRANYDISYHSKRPTQSPYPGSATQTTQRRGTSDSCAKPQAEPQPKQNTTSGQEKKKGSVYKKAVDLIVVLICGILYMLAVAWPFTLIGLIFLGTWSCERMEAKEKAAHRAEMQKQEQPLPFSGRVRFFGDGRRIAPFQIKASYGEHYLLKLVSVTTGESVLDVFVRSGTTVEIEVPLGDFEVRYASGTTWYGYERLFGPETSYSKADKPFSFWFEGDQIRGYTITLYKVANGNLHTKAIDPKDF